MFFHKSYLPSDEFMGWVFETYEWFLKNLGGWDRFSQTQLVLPTQAHYPPQSESGPALAEAYLRITKAHAKMEGWPCVLEPQVDIDEKEKGGDVPPSSSPNETVGVYSLRSEGIVLTYSELELADPVALIAMMAHELGHFLYYALPGDPPGGKEGKGPAIDTVAHFLGFGLFQCNRVQRLKAAGPEAASVGSLDERQMAYALAVFCMLREVELADVRKHLTGNPRSYIKAAFKDLKSRWSDRVEALRRIPPAQVWPQAVPEASSKGMADYYCRIAWWLLSEEKQKAAVAYFTKALRVSPLFADALAGRGEASRLVGDKAQALADLNKLVEAHPDQEHSYYCRGRLYASDGEEEKAVEAFTRALSIKPDWAEALRARAEVHAKRGASETALMDVEKCLELDPEDLEARLSRAFFLRDLGRWEEGVEDVSACLSQNPEDLKALGLRALLFMQLKRFDEAVLDYSEMLLQDPFDIETLLGRAQAYMSGDHIPDALADCDQILEQEPEHEEALRVRQKAAEEH